MTPLILIITAAILFCMGFLMVVARRNAVLALIGIELMLNSANLNFVAFSSTQPDRIGGQVSALLVMAIAAAEAAVGLAIILNVYKKFRTVDLDQTDTLKD